ncbi:MAG TPA: FAD-dependent oxidoreductase [Anaerolineae bacterium]|nr:FAD-dependent oxidoreductase [Anaerolineae bacterium]
MIIKLIASLVVFILASNTDSFHNVIIIGGGLAGLSAALHLAERGLQPIVLEADPDRAGGRVSGGQAVELTQADQLWCFPAEHGIHGFWSQYHNLRGMLNRHHILPQFVAAKQEEWIIAHGSRIKRAEAGSHIRGSWVPAPFHYLNLLIRPSFLRILDIFDWFALPFVLAKLLVALSIDPLREGKSLQGMSLAQFTWGWTPNLRAFFAALARSGLSAHPEQVPLDGFIAFLRFYTLTRRDAWAFEYFVADSGSALIDPIVHKVIDLGGQIEFDQAVQQIDREADTWIIRTNRSSFRARSIILAVDAPNAKQILCQSPITRVAATRFEFPIGIATAILRVWFDRSPRNGPEAGIFSGDFTLDNFFWLDRFQTKFMNWRAATGGSAIESHVYGPPEVLKQPDSNLISTLLNDIHRAWPELNGHSIHYTLQRNKPAHTLFKIGTTESRLGTETLWPDLFVCGDWIRHPTPALFLERACITGIDAANAVLESNQIDRFLLIPHTPPEPLARGIEEIMHGLRRGLHRLRRN